MDGKWLFLPYQPYPNKQRNVNKEHFKKCFRSLEKLNIIYELCFYLLYPLLLCLYFQSEGVLNLLTLSSNFICSSKKKPNCLCAYHVHIFPNFLLKSVFNNFNKMWRKIHDPNFSSSISKLCWLFDSVFHIKYIKMVKEYPCLSPYYILFVCQNKTHWVLKAEIQGEFPRSINKKKIFILKYGVILKHDHGNPQMITVFKKINFRCIRVSVVQFEKQKQCACIYDHQKSVLVGTL